jgi:hypothetical protein
MLQWLYTYLQVSVPHVLSVFQMYVASVFIWMLYMFHTYIANVLSGCCICVSMVFQVFSGVFACVSAVCFKCFKRMFQVFICLHTYVANVSPRYFRNRSGVAVGDSPAAASLQAGK